MADEKLNTGPAENISPEAAEPITTPEQAAASEPQQEQTGPAIPESGDVVVSFDKINELMAEKRQNARAEVEKSETPETPEAAAPGETPQPANTEEPKKPRRGRPPKAEKAATENQKAEKSAGARKGRPPKADKAAPDKPKPSKRDKVSRSDGKAPDAKEPIKPAQDTALKETAAVEQTAPEPTTPPRPVEEGKLVYLKLSEVHPFHTFRPHPFKVRDDAKMQEIVASIRVNGVMVPGLARPEKDGNGYEIVAGHRRTHGSELAGLEEMPFIVREMTDHEAVQAMKDSNKQRDGMLPSELAALLELEVEDIKHQGGRLKGVAEGDVGKRSVEIVGEAHEMNYKKVMRYLRLNSLVPELLDKVDDKKMGFMPAVELSYQTSKKIRQVFDYKRRNGQYIGAFAPYGYVKHPKDKHRLIVDPDAAENVKLIFTMLIQGSSKRAIALYLNEHGVPSPSAYKVQKGLPVSTRGYDDPMWGVRMIHSILTNPTYTGDLAQGRSRVKSYKVHQIEAVPREEWVEVAGTHEAIIDYETFDKVQALLQRDTRTSPKGREVHLFSGFLKCADCGRAITRCVGKNNNVYYSCSTYKNRSRTACTMHSIKHERLEAAVLFAVQHQVHLAVSYSEIVTQINSAPIKKSQSYRLDDLIAAKERELTKITRYKQSLYQDWKDGEITQQEYRDMKADYERQTSDISAVLTRLNAERAELANGVDNEHPALVAFMKYQNIEALNREILVELVDYIKVYENGNISVKFKFADELRKIAEYIEINTTEDTAVAG